MKTKVSPDIQKIIDQAQDNYTEDEKDYLKEKIIMAELQRQSEDVDLVTKIFSSHKVKDIKQQLKDCKTRMDEASRKVIWMEQMIIESITNRLIAENEPDRLRELDKKAWEALAAYDKASNVKTLYQVPRSQRKATPLEEFFSTVDPMTSTKSMDQNIAITREIHENARRAVDAFRKGYQDQAVDIFNDRVISQNVFGEDRSKMKQRLGTITPVFRPYH